MKSYYLAALIFSMVFLFGCPTSPPQESDCQDIQLELYKAQLDYSALDERYDLVKAQFDECIEAKEACESQEAEDCSAIEAELDALNESYNTIRADLSECIEAKEECESQEPGTCSEAEDCSAIEAELNAQIDDCNSGKATLSTSLGECESEKDQCETDLEAALAAVRNTTVKHYVRGNLHTSGDYKTTSFFLGEGYDETLKKAIVGLDYTGGTDTFFAASVSTTYGLNRIRWYTMTTEDGTNFSSDIDDTVVIEGSTIKIKGAEFDAGTSKEGLALRRIIAIFIHE